ncbi:MAG TPA: hypothetical protein VIT88_09895 [Pyrinomonadaceae bacterium]
MKDHRTPKHLAFTVEEPEANHFKRIQEGEFDLIIKIHVDNAVETNRTVGSDSW